MSLVQTYSIFAEIIQISMAKTTEQKIVKAAQKVFYAKGYRGATMRDIAKTADVNLALLHYYFGKKEKLLEVVFDEGFTYIFLQFRKALDFKGDIFERIRLIVDCYVSTGCKYPQLFGFIVNEFSINPEFMNSLLKQYETQNNLSLPDLDTEIKKAVQEKKIKPVDTRKLLLDILSLCHYPFVARNFLTSLFDMDKKSFDELIKQRSEEISNTIINSIRL